MSRIPSRLPEIPPASHKASHQDGGADEISVADLSGELTDAQKSTWTKVSGKPTTFTPEAHKASHQVGGSDEVVGLIRPGFITIFGGPIANIPSGWALCNGATLSKTTYPALFAAIGYTHGGSGDNFNIPDLRNNFIPGAGDVYVVGETGGDAYHNHELDASTGGPSETDNASAGPIGVGTNVHTHDIYGTAASSLGLPPYRALAYIIKL